MQHCAEWCPKRLLVATATKSRENSVALWFANICLTLLLFRLSFSSSAPLSPLYAAVERTSRKTVNLQHSRRYEHACYDFWVFPALHIIGYCFRALLKFYWFCDVHGKILWRNQKYKWIFFTNQYGYWWELFNTLCYMAHGPVARGVARVCLKSLLQQIKFHEMQPSFVHASLYTWIIHVNLYGM